MTGVKVDCHETILNTLPLNRCPRDDPSIPTVEILQTNAHETQYIHPWTAIIQVFVIDRLIISSQECANIIPETNISQFLIIMFGESSLLIFSAKVRYVSKALVVDDFRTFKRLWFFGSIFPLTVPTFKVEKPVGILGALANHDYIVF